MSNNKDSCNKKLVKKTLEEALNTLQKFIDNPYEVMSLGNFTSDPQPPMVSTCTAPVTDLKDDLKETITYIETLNNDRSKILNELYKKAGIDNSEEYNIVAYPRKGFEMFGIIPCKYIPQDKIYFIKKDAVLPFKPFNKE